MVTDRQVRRLRKLIQKEPTKAAAAAKAGMDEKTARKYLRTGKLPSEIAAEHEWRTRPDPFEGVWEELKGKLMLNPGLEAKTLFEDLQRRFPGRFMDGQLRTLQRKVRRWRVLEGPPREVFFEQEHRPGELCQSDFTDMGELAITIGGVVLEHLLYHFVLSYSNWETGRVCFSESFESLSWGLQEALWELGGVPGAHRTDRLTAAVQKPNNPEEFTQRYGALLRHYGMKGVKTQGQRPNENGDVEQRHYRFKKALDQALMLRGSRDFPSRKDYEGFIRRLFQQLNAGRQKRLNEELKVLRRLPARKLPICKRLRVRVSGGSTIRVGNNTYSIDSRLIGEQVRVRVYAESLEVWYAQRCLERIPRLRGEGKHHIQYRHIIEWLIRKPGAFENYRYREDLFPTVRFRMAYDSLKREHTEQKAAKEYLRILLCAAREGESLVDDVLRGLLDLGTPIVVADVEMYVASCKRTAVMSATEVKIESVDLGAYDGLLACTEVL
jgi:hypothetical protein